MGSQWRKLTQVPPRPGTPRGQRHRPLDRRSGRQLASRLLSSPGSLSGSHPRQLHPLGQSLERSARQEAAAAGAVGAAAGAAAAGIARECALGSASSLAPALTSTSPSGRPSVFSSEDVTGAGCGMMPRSPPLPPLPFPLAFSGRAACGCQSRGRAIRLRAGSGPAPSVFLIKEAAAETRGTEPRAAAPSSGGAVVAHNPAAARSKLRCLAHRSTSPTQHLLPAPRTSVQGCGWVTPRGRSALPSGRAVPAGWETPQSPGNACSS